MSSGPRSVRASVILYAMALAVCCSPAIACAQAVQGPSTQGNPGASDKGAPPTVSNPNDFYYYGSKRINLARSLVECVVSFNPQAEIRKESVLRGLLRSAAFDGEIRSEGRTFHIVTIPSGGTASLERLMDQLRSNTNDVQFVVPVFYQPPTRGRMFPTDQVVVKLKPEGTRQELTRVAATHGLVVLEPMPATNDQYVLRLSDPRKGDALESARTMHQSGRFEWAQPDFVREMEKRAPGNVRPTGPVSP